MTISKLKDVLHRLTKLYFTDAHVTFTKQSFMVKPVQPLVTLSVISVSRPLHPPTKIIDGRPAAFYPASAMIQIDLFTNGSQTEVAEGFTPIAENTAQDDLLGFASFLNAAYAADWCEKHDIAIIVPNTVQDMTGLIHDTSYEFRAMMEITVYFTMTAIGYTGTLSPTSVKHITIGEDGKPHEYEGGNIQADDVSALVPEIEVTPSGGGNSAFADEESGYFTDVEINDKRIKEEK